MSRFVAGAAGSILSRHKRIERASGQGSAFLTLFPGPCVQGRGGITSMAAAVAIDGAS